MSNFLLTVLETETNNKLLLIFQKSDHTDFTSDHFSELRSVLIEQMC